MTDKICINCKHSKQQIEFGASSTYFNHICIRQYTISLVTGEPIYKGPALDCLAEREDALRLEQFRCGTEGKFYEPKELVYLNA